MAQLGGPDRRSDCLPFHLEASHQAAQPSAPPLPFTSPLSNFRAVWLILGSAVAILLGIGFLSIGYQVGWAFFPLAGVKLIIVAFHICVARLPFRNEVEDDEDLVK